MFPEVYKKAKAQEAERFQFMIDRDGIDKAKEFGLRVRKQYEDQVRDRKGMCGDRFHRLKFIAAARYYREVLK